MIAAVTDRLTQVSEPFGGWVWFWHYCASIKDASGADGIHVIFTPPAAADEDWEEWIEAEDADTWAPAEIPEWYPACVTVDLVGLYQLLDNVSEFKAVDDPENYDHIRDFTGDWPPYVRIGGMYNGHRVRLDICLTSPTNTMPALYIDEMGDSYPNPDFNPDDL